MRTPPFLLIVLLALGGCGSSDAPEVAAERTSSANSDFDHPRMKPIDADVDDPAALEEALAQNPGHSPILMRMAEIARQAGDHAKAVEHLEAAVAAEPDDLDARLELGRALYEAGDVAGATLQTETIVERDPNHVDALYNLGAIYANQGVKDQAVEHWTRAVAAAPGSPSGQNAQRGLDSLAGRMATTQSIPDIPEHRGITSGSSAPPASIHPGDREKLIRFASEAAQP